MVLKMAGGKPNERMLGEDEEQELGTGTSIRLGFHRKEVVVKPGREHRVCMMTEGSSRDLVGSGASRHKRHLSFSR